MSIHENRPAAPVLPQQSNFKVAAQKALEAVRNNFTEQLIWLGARPIQNRWTLSVLNELLIADFTDGLVYNSDGRRCGAWWQILTLHYLGLTERPLEQTPTVTFADLPEGRAYAPVLRMRATDRLCRTVGLYKQALLNAGQSLGGKEASLGDLGFEFQVFPRVRLRLAWHAGDEEFPPYANILLPPNIKSFFCIEDIVVLCERLVSRLLGGPF